MNHTRTIIPSLAAGIALLAGAVLSVGCEGPIRVTSVDESRYAIPEGAMVYLADGQGRRNFTVDEFRGEGSTVLTLTSTAGSTGAATIEYSAEGLARYNDETGNNYPAFPSSLVSFSGSQLNAGSSVTVSYTAGDGVENNVTYVIPIKVTATSGSVSDTDTYRYIFVKDLSGFPDPAKDLFFRHSMCFGFCDLLLFLVILRGKVRLKFRQKKRRAQHCQKPESAQHPQKGVQRKKLQI